MSREFFEKLDKQQPEKIAFSISGGTDLERLNKMRELLSSVTGYGDHMVFGSGAQVADIMIKLHGAQLEEVTIENPILVMIDFDVSKHRNHLGKDFQYDMDFIRELATQQGNVIELTSAPSLLLR